MPNVLLPAASRKLPQPLSGDDIRKLLAEPDASRSLGARDQAMLELLYATGLRVSELVALETRHISFQGDYLTIKGKGAKVSAVPFGRWAREKLTLYINDVRPRLLEGRLQSVRVYQSFGKTLEPARLLEAYTPLCADGGDR